MGFIDDVKEDQTLQIQVICVALFMIAFPSYFFIKAAATDDPAGMGGVGTYTVTGEFSYIDFDNGGGYITDGDTLTIPLNTDALSSEDQGKNIVGILVSMSYEEDEQAQGVPCFSQTAPDTITGSATHLEFSNSADGQNQGGSGSHDVATTWYNESMIGTEVNGLSESEIVDQLDSNGAGLGDYTIEISVNAQGDSCTGIGAGNEDNGEDVSYTIQLIVLDFEITPYVEIEDI